MNHREASKKSWGTRAKATEDEINMGSLQRIADATEKMAQNWDALIEERDRYERWYKQTHTEKKLVSKFVYGLAELNRKKLQRAKLVACGGCEATAIILALHPLAKAGLIKKNDIIADVKIGSSAAGNKSSSASHHPERHGTLRSYKPTNHRHEVEIRQETGLDVEISATAVNLVVEFSQQSTLK